MKIVNLIQGAPEWHAHRAQHLNASDAPAMLGCSPYTSRAQLVRQAATGIAPEVDEATQRRFDDGHRAEALARPVAEAIVGEDLFPCVGTEGKYSASFDGLTLLEDTAFEHKALNDTLRTAMVDGCSGADLPKVYRVQMEQQCMVSGAARVLFMASKWAGEELVEERHCWYTPDAALRAEIVAGWEQFEADVAAYVPEAAPAPAAAGRAPDQLPALRVEVTGMVTASNLAEWKAGAIAVFQAINTDLQTDQDFADAERTVKWCGDIEDQLKAAKSHALSQTSSIEELFRTIDSISAEARAKRLELDKLVKHRKEAIRGEIVSAAADSVRAHYDGINATLGAHALAYPAREVASDMGGAIKGRKSLSSMRDAVDSMAAHHKVAASQAADQIRANVAILDEHQQHAHLFADRVALCASKAPDDLRNLVAARVAEFERAEEQRREQDRERIRQEEADRLQREQQAAEADARHRQEAEEAAERQHDAEEPGNSADLQSSPGVVTAQPAATVSPLPAQQQPVAAAAPAIAPDVRIKLGDINVLIAPLSITADGLAALGFRPVGQDRAAKLYAAADLPRICAALVDVINQAPARAAERIAA